MRNGYYSKISTETMTSKKPLETELQEWFGKDPSKEDEAAIKASALEYFSSHSFTVSFPGQEIFEDIVEAIILDLSQTQPLWQHVPACLRQPSMRFKKLKSSIKALWDSPSIFKTELEEFKVKKVKSVATSQQENKQLMTDLKPSAIQSGGRASPKAYGRVLRSGVVERTFEIKTEPQQKETPRPAPSSGQKGRGRPRGSNSQAKEAVEQETDTAQAIESTLVVPDNLTKGLTAATPLRQRGQLANNSSLEDENRELRARMIKTKLKYRQKLEEIKNRLSQSKVAIKQELQRVESYITNSQLNMDCEAEIELGDGARTPWQP